MNVQGDLLDLIPKPGDPGDQVRAIADAMGGDPIHARDRRRIVAAILADALAHSGLVNPNRVRAALTNKHGIDVYPRLIGATYNGLTRAGILAFEGWTTSDDHRGGNAGKPARCYRLTLPLEAA